MESKTPEGFTRTNFSKNLRGFTLIELMVAVGISLLLAGSVLVGFNTFSTNQRVKQAALNFKNNLRLAQTKAQSGEKPATGCTSLVGYNVNFTNSNYSIVPLCTEGEITPKTLRFDLPQGVAFAAFVPSLTYKTLSAGVQLPGHEQFTFQITNLSKTYSLRLNTNGEIDDLGFISE